MNALLLSEISSEHVNPINALALIEQFIFEQDSTLKQQIDEIIEHCQQGIDPQENELQQVESLLDTIFVEQLFVDNKREHWSSQSFIPSEATQFKVISPALKLILIQYIVQACGLECDVVYIPDTFMIRIICEQDYAVIFDPVTGIALNWVELDLRMSDAEGDPSQHTLSSENNQLLLINYLTALKNNLIGQAKFQQALKCVDILIALHPDDPIERRDRGFLLHQLDCFKVAYDDYQYFVEKCPQDPAAQLLKIQLENIKISQNILH